MSPRDAAILDLRIFLIFAVPGFIALWLIWMSGRPAKRKRWNRRPR